jgi:hypothetical protein
MSYQSRWFRVEKLDDMKEKIIANASGLIAYFRGNEGEFSIFCGKWAWRGSTHEADTLEAYLLERGAIRVLNAATMEELLAE